MPKDQIIVRLNPDVPPTGSDLGITNAARRSFGRRSEWDTEAYTTSQGNAGWRNVLKDKDKRLLEFLARGMTADDFDEFLGQTSESALQDSLADYSSELVSLLWQWRNTPTHDTPFNHGFFSFEIKAPIFVARHLVKHEYLIMSEYSRRYITDDIEFYQPDEWRMVAEDIKQGSGGVSPLSWTWSTEYYNTLLPVIEQYNYMVREGIAPEQARMILPQSLMTSWTWSGTLGAFANMCKLRLGSDTQAETRYVAEKVYEELKKQFPIAAPLLVEGVY